MDDVVVGVDQSGTARAAAERAADLASAYGVNLHLVMCIEGNKSVAVRVGTDQFQGDWISDAKLALDDIARKLPHDQVTTAIVVGDPAKMLCEEASKVEARTIVVGNRRVQGMSRILGSIAGDVIKHAPCDVLVANTTGAQ